MRRPAWQIKGTRGNLWEIHNSTRTGTRPVGPPVSMSIACEVVDTLNGRARLVRTAAGDRILASIRKDGRFE